MCGAYEHSRWYEQDGIYHVFIDREVNSHAQQNEKWPVPAEVVCHKSGVSIVNGTPRTNDGTPLPDEVATRLALLFDAAFPDRSCIVQFIQTNYGKHKDAKEWNVALIEMVALAGLRMAMGSDWCKVGSDWYKAKSTRWKKMSDEYKALSDRYNYVSDAYTALSDEYKALSDRYKAASDRWQAASEIPCAGAFEKWGLATFLAVFDEYPNEYWARRETPREEPYPVREEVQIPIVQNSGGGRLTDVAVR